MFDPYSKCLDDSLPMRRMIRMHILHMLEGMFLLDVAHLTTVVSFSLISFPRKIVTDISCIVSAGDNLHEMSIAIFRIK